MPPTRLWTHLARVRRAENRPLASLRGGGRGAFIDPVGVHAGILPPVPRAVLNELLYQMGPATLDARVASSEADHSRATYVRAAFERY